MTTTIKKPVTYDLYRLDRPGWIPETVGDDWDPHPYAYQTREDLMPAGHLHGIYLHTLLAMLKPVLDRLKLRLFIDVFIFYRDWEGRRQRIAPDALFAPTWEEGANESLHKYDLDYEPVPVCAIEVISPSSRKSDQYSKCLFYASLGISEYLVLDVEDDNEQPLPQIGISLWRLQDGIHLPIEPDTDGFLTIMCLGVRLRAEGRKLIALEIATEEELLDTPDLRQARQQAEHQARVEAAARYHAEQRERAEMIARKQAEEQANAEAAARQQAERQADAEAVARKQAEEQANAEAAARQQAERQADAATAARKQAEAEVARLREEIARLTSTAPET